MKVALITGASRGIGRETAKIFAQNGYFVLAHYNQDKQGVIDLISELETNGIKDTVFPVQADFNDVKSIEKMFFQIHQSFKHIDVLVNNAGVGLYKLMTDTTEEEWDKLFNVNVKGQFILTKKVLPEMIKRQCGSIVNVSSIWGQNGACMETVYSATKSSIIGFTKALAKEVAPSGVRVNCVCPGVIDTKMNQIFNTEEINQLIEETPLGRLGTGRDVAELIYFLASEKASFITGQVVTIDGGFAL